MLLENIPTFAVLMIIPVFKCLSWLIDQSQYNVFL